MAYRAEKSGIAAQAQNKIQAKYDDEIAQQCLEWISQKTGQSFSTSGQSDNFHAVLKDGLVLLALMDKLMPGSVSQKLLNSTSKMPFKQMECVGAAIEAMLKYGIQDHEKFQTVDLYEAQNLHQVQCCLQALGRKANAKGQGGFGPKEASANVRNFSDEQMKAGQNVIGLQMGTNKGASQKGMNIGNTRHIVD